MRPGVLCEQTGSGVQRQGTYDDATAFVNLRYDGVLVAAKAVLLHVLLDLLVYSGHLALQLRNGEVLGAPLPVLGLRASQYMRTDTIDALIRTQTEKGTVNARRVTTVTRIMVHEYGGHSGGKGSAMAKSRKPSDSP